MSEKHCIIQMNFTVFFANGTKENPTYEEVCRRDTGHAEACYVTYDENLIGLEQLINKFWQIIDPTVANRQGNDIGHQYRTGIFYTDKDDLPVILKSRDEEQKKYSKTIVTEIEPLSSIYARLLFLYRAFMYFATIQFFRSNIT